MSADPSLTDPSLADPTFADSPDRVVLADAVRALMLAAGTSTVGSQERARAEELIAEATELLAKQTRPRVPRSEYPAPNRARELGIPFHRSAGNPASVPLAIHFDGDSAQATVTINALQEGPPDSVHGGTLAWLMDCMTGALVQSTLRPSVTGTLELRYKRRTPLDRQLSLGSRITSQSGRKTVVEAWIELDGERTVEARGLFIEVPFETRAHEATHSVGARE
ncbi:MAG TPA: PaaI family thioesterase [Nocardioides sp.]